MDWVFLTVAAIFLICIIIGIYKGALRIAVSLATTLVTLVIVFFASPYAADAIIKYTPVDEMIQDKVSSAMTDAAAEYLAAGAEDIMEDGISREDVEKALEAAGISEEQLEAYDITIDDIVDGDISSEQLSELGLADKLSGLVGAGDEDAKEDAGSALESMDIPRDLQQEAISEADMIILGPGSLYTSIIPNLLVEGIARAVADADALKVYVANVMTQEGETEGYTNADHIQAIFQHSLPGLFHLCLVNSASIPREVTERYAQEGAEPVRYDKNACAQLGVELVSRPVSAVRDGLVRHDPELLAAALLELHAQRSVRIAGLGKYRTE